jgi:hypothetical protein
MYMFTIKIQEQFFTIKIRSLFFLQLRTHISNAKFWRPELKTVKIRDGRICFQRILMTKANRALQLFILCLRVTRPRRHVQLKYDMNPHAFH